VTDRAILKGFAAQQIRKEGVERAGGKGREKCRDRDWEARERKGRR